MKKKCLLALAVCLLITAICTSLFACGSNIDEDYFTPTDYSGMKKATDIEYDSAFDLFLDVVETWKTDSYLRTELFSFEARALNAVAATQSTKTYYKVADGYTYKKEVKVGTGLGKENDARKFYQDIANGTFYRVEMDDDKTNVPNKGEGDEIFNVVKWDDWAVSEEDVETDTEAARVIREHLTTYIYTDREKSLSDKHDDTIYEKDGEYWFTITLDCSDTAMNSLHTAARDEIIRNTGADANKPLKMDADTLLEFRVKLIDGKYRMVYYRRLESYTGYQGPAKTSCRQFCMSTFDYTPSAYAIEDETFPA